MTGNPRFAWDRRRRFLENFATVVLGVPSHLFANRLAEILATEGASTEQALDSEAIERLASSYQQLAREENRILPEDPMEQLSAAAQAVYRSWMSARACTYREHENLDDLRGTAVTIQAMVFGNRNLSSGAGVAFSRDPSTGAAEPVIDVLFGSQGEDVVSGTRTPETEEAINRMAPGAATQLRDILALLEHEYGDVQDVEFAIEDGKLWVLQTRSAKRTPLAALRFAIAFVNEGLITPLQALQRLDGLDVEALTSCRLINACEPAALGTGASAGIAVGRAVVDSQIAERLAAGGDPIILLRPDTSTADVAGFVVSARIVTAAGGRTAHAALVARQMGKPCIVGTKALVIDAESHSAEVSGIKLNEGDWLSIDGETGAIYFGRCDVTVDRPEAELAEVERWRNWRQSSDDIAAVI
jgi:pyruvate, orthophosphate dikinase